MRLHDHFDVFGFTFERNAKVIAVSIGINRGAVNAVCHSLLAEELGTNSLICAALSKSTALLFENALELMRDLAMENS
jgi:hypothetical protein